MFKYRRWIQKIGRECREDGKLGFRASELSVCGGVTEAKNRAPSS